MRNRSDKSQLLENRWVSLISFLMMLFFSLTASGQNTEVKFRVIGREAGLSNSSILSLYEDSEGFIWLGTVDGLNKYDGFRTTVFQNKPNDSSSISGNYASGIAEDREHNIWIATSSGLNKFSRFTNGFQRFTYSADNASSISSNNANCIYKDRDGALWIGTSFGLNQLNNDGKSFTRFLNPSSVAHCNIIRCIYEDVSGKYWIGTEAGLFIFDSAAKSFTNFQLPDNSFPTTGITSIAADGSGNVYIGTSTDGLIVINKARSSAKFFRHSESDNTSLSSNAIKSLFYSKTMGLWVGTENGGLNLYNNAAGNFLRYQNNPDNPSSFSQKTASVVFEDRSGNLWVGTHRGGVDVYSPRINKFITYSQRHNGLSFKDIKTFFEDKDGNIWIGTDGGGINIWNRKTGQFTYYKHSETDPSSIGSDAILHIMQDSHQRIWIGTWNGGLNLYLGNGRFKRYLHDAYEASSISSNNVFRIFEDSRGKLWIGTFYGGLNTFDPATQKFERITADPLKRTAFLGNNVVSIAEDKNGDMWFGTDDGGLNYYNVHENEFEHYFNQKRNDGTGISGNLRVIFVDSQKRLWVGQKGLFQFDYNKKNFSLYSNDPSLAYENIQIITEDKNGSLWISNRNGLIAFNTTTKTLKHYGIADGLQGLEFNQNANLTLKDGSILVGGFNGFNLFDPRKMSADAAVGPVYITDFQVFNKNMDYGADGSPLQKAISQTDEIILNHNQSVFSFEYAALDYAMPEETRYAYKLDGFDKNWNYVNTQRKATFTNLDPGTYTFHVKAGNMDGKWSDKIASVRIVIRPPFWRTWWFEMLSLALLCCIVYIVLFYRRKYELKKLDEQKAKELQQMQLQFFTNISHEFRTPLSLIAGPLEKMKQEDIQPVHKQYYQMMQRNVNRLMSLISELMDFRKVEAGVLKLQVMPDNINTFVQNVAVDFEDLAIQKNIDFEVKIPNENNDDIWFDHKVVEKIIINLIHNAFKYTAEGGRITMEVMHSLQHFKPLYENELLVKSDYTPNKQIFLRIADTGKGISKASISYLFERYYRITQEHLGSGIGLAFVKSLTLLHKGSIQVYSQLNTGTEIIICLPCGEKDYSSFERWTDQPKDASAELESIRYKKLASQQDMEAPILSTEPDHAKKHILIVDDNEELRTFLHACLSSQYRISLAEDGEQGFDKAKEEMPDLIISDVMMPVMNGIDFCKSVKEDIDTSHIPFILLTAKDAFQSKLDGLSGGADHYFSKPVSIELLQLTIKNIFAQRQKIKDRFSHDYKVEVKELVHSTKDKEFMDNLLQMVEEQMENTDLNVDFICQKIGMSKTKLYKKIKDITGQTINEFVRSFRLKKAVEIMVHEDVSITEVMFRVGIQSNSYFTTIFKKEYSKTPSQFLQDLKNNKQHSNS